MFRSDRPGAAAALLSIAIGSLGLAKLIHGHHPEIDTTASIYWSACALEVACAAAIWTRWTAPVCVLIVLGATALSISIALGWTSGTRCGCLGGISLSDRQRLLLASGLGLWAAAAAHETRQRLSGRQNRRA